METAQSLSLDEELEAAKQNTLSNLGRLKESRSKGESVLEETFEGRMNRSLDRWAELHRFGGQAVLLNSSDREPLDVRGTE